MFLYVLKGISTLLYFHRYFVIINGTLYLSCSVQKAAFFSVLTKVLSNPIIFKMTKAIIINLMSRYCKVVMRYAMTSLIASLRGKLRYEIRKKANYKLTEHLRFIGNDNLHIYIYMYVIFTCRYLYVVYKYLY